MGSAKEMYIPRDQGVKIFENESLEVKIFDDQEIITEIKQEM